MPTGDGDTAILESVSTTLLQVKERQEIYSPRLEFNVSDQAM